MHDSNIAFRNNKKKTRCMEHPPILRLALLAVCSSFVLASVANAQEAPKSGKDWLFGDWNGKRTELQEKGITFNFGHIAEFATNTSGGEQELSRYTDQWTLGATLDLDKLWGIPNATFRINITDRNGDNLSDDAGLGTLQQVQEVYGRGQTWRWTEVYYQQTYANDKLDWKIGRLPVGEDFASFSCDFMNLSFCGSSPGNIGSGSYWYNWPVSQWATRLKFNFGDQGYVQVGAYQLNPGYLRKGNEARFDSPEGTIGTLYPLEAAWTPKFGARALAGSYKFGVWYADAELDDVLLDTDGNALSVSGGSPLRRSSGYGGYFMAQQTVFHPDGDDGHRGLDLFFHYAQADRRTAAFDRQLRLGLFYNGPFASRPDDEIGFAVASNRVNDRARTGVALANAAGLPARPLPHTEYVGELFYGAQLTPFLTLRPNIQYIHDAGGISSAKDIWVVGMKTSLAF